MRSLIRNISINFVSIFLVSRIAGAIDFSENLVILFWAALSLSLLNLIVKPVLNLLLTPINLVTLGAFRWVVNVVVLFAVSIFISEFKITGFTFEGLNFAGFVIPQIKFTFFWALVLVSFLIEIVSAGVSWIFTSK